MSQLLTKHDYLSLVQKLFNFALTQPDRRELLQTHAPVQLLKNHRNILRVCPAGALREPDTWERFRRNLMLAPDILKVHLRRDYLHFLNCIRQRAIVSDPDLRQQVLKWWQDLAAAVDISEDALLAEANAERRKVVGDLSSGCSWFKCVIFEQDCDPALLFQCAGCHKSRYCGELCQGR